MAWELEVINWTQRHRLSTFSSLCNFPMQLRIPSILIFKVFIWFTWNGVDWISINYFWSTNLPIEKKRKIHLQNSKFQPEPQGPSNLEDESDSAKKYSSTLRKKLRSFSRTRVRSLSTLVSNCVTATDWCFGDLIDVTLACEDANSWWCWCWDACCWQLGRYLEAEAWS